MGESSKKTKKLELVDSKSINFYFLFWNIFFADLKKNDAKGINVTQPIWLPGCPEKGHFSDKNAFISAVLNYIFIFSKKIEKRLISYKSVLKTKWSIFGSEFGGVARAFITIFSTASAELRGGC